MAQKYVLLPVGKTIDDLSADPLLAKGYADVELPHDTVLEWIFNDTDRLIFLAQKPEPVDEEPEPEPKPEV